MASARTIGRSAGFVLGEKLDTIPFSGYHILIIAVLAAALIVLAPSKRARRWRVPATMLRSSTI